MKKSKFSEEQIACALQRPAHGWPRSVGSWGTLPNKNLTKKDGPSIEAFFRLSRHFINREAGARSYSFNPAILSLTSSTSAIPGSASF